MSWGQTGSWELSASRSWYTGKRFANLLTGPISCDSGYFKFLKLDPSDRRYKPQHSSKANLWSELCTLSRLLKAKWLPNTFYGNWTYAYMVERCVGAIQSDFDPCIFMRKNEDDFQGILATHVDFLEFRGKFPCTLVNLLIAQGIYHWQGSRSSSRSFGIEIESRMGLNLSQYIQTTTEYIIPPGLKADDELDENLRSALKALVGKPLWPATNSRPDLCFDTSNLAASVSVAINWPARWQNLKAKRKKLWFPCLEQAICRIPCLPLNWEILCCL